MRSPWTRCWFKRYIFNTDTKYYHYGSSMQVYVWCQSIGMLYLLGNIASHAMLLEMFWTQTLINLIPLPLFPKHMKQLGEWCSPSSMFSLGHFNRGFFPCSPPIRIWCQIYLLSNSFQKTLLFLPCQSQSLSHSTTPAHAPTSSNTRRSNWTDSK